METYTEKADKWIWKADYCKKNLWNPCDSALWDLAEKAWEEYKNSISEENNNAT